MMAEHSFQFDTTLSTILDNYLTDEKYTDALSVIHDNRNKTSLNSNCSDTINIIIKHLSDENFDKKPKTYEISEQLLKIVAQLVNPEEVLFELLEIVETTQSDNIFTSTLKALQICLLRQKTNKARSLEWCLNSIRLYIAKLPVSSTLVNKIEDEEERLLEENPEMHRILSNYLIIFLFNEPIVKELYSQQSAGIFRDVAITRRNVFGCFLLQLLGRPLYYLDLSKKDGIKTPTNTYSRQCAITLVDEFGGLFRDPFFLLAYVEKKVKFPVKLKNTDGIYKDSPKDIFTLDEKIPIDAIGVFYYLIFAEDLMPKHSPCIYSHLYFVEMVLYILAELFKFNENALHSKAIKLANAVLDKLAAEQIPYSSLDLDVHEHFSTGLVKIIIQSPSQQNSQNTALLLKRYILQFNDAGRFFLITKFFQMVDHNPLVGYLIHLYKTILAEVLDREQNQLPYEFTGVNFANILMNYICKLRNGTETDLIQNCDIVISALNMLRYLAIRDQTNRTGFLDCIGEIKEKYLKPLRLDVDMSRAHYKLEHEKRFSSKADDSFSMEMIPKALNTFDLIDSILARVNECIRLAADSRFVSEIK